MEESQEPVQQIEEVAVKGDVATLTKQEPASETVPMLDGVPYDIIQHFSIDAVNLTPKTRDRLRDIYKMLPGENFTEKFRSLINVERRLGSSGSIPRYQKIWNWLRVNRSIQTTGEKAILRQIAIEESTKG